MICSVEMQHQKSVSQYRKDSPRQHPWTRLSKARHCCDKGCSGGGAKARRRRLLLAGGLRVGLLYDVVNGLLEDWLGAGGSAHRPTNHRGLGRCCGGGPGTDENRL